ncbi:MAG: ABC transporter permease subunit [Gemmatimonadaceae bacterium]
MSRDAPLAAHAVNRRRGKSAGLLAAALLAAPVLVGLAYAIGASLGVVAAANDSQPSLARIARVLGERATWDSVLWTLWVAASATGLAVVGAVAVAVAFRGHARGDRVGRALAALPLPMPHLVAGMLGVWLLGQSGIAARAAFALGLIVRPAEMPPLVYDRLGVGLVLTLAWKEMAFLAIVSSALLATRGAAAEEAARTLGASPWETFRRVTWPLLWRGLAPAVVAVFVFVAGNYEAAALLAPSDPLALPLLVAQRATDPDLARHADAYVASVLLLVIASAAVAAHEWVRARWEPFVP